MARRGWVAAEVGPDEWRRLSVFDDGWVELPGFARGLSDTRRQARVLLVGLAALTVLLVLPRVLGALGLPDDVDRVVTSVAQAAGLLLLVVLGGVVIVWRLRNLQQSGADLDQARREKARGQTVRLTPGAPMFRRADSAATYAAWTEGEVHVEALDVVEVTTRRDGRVHVVEVRLADGATRTYRSPDGKLPALLAAFGHGPHQR